MSKNKLKEESKIMESNKVNPLIRWPYLPIVIVIVMAGIVFGFYFYHFSGGLSSEHGRWSEFGGFIGGTLSPILSFFALIALLSTVALQNKQLDISSKELKETREALQKSAEAQDKMQEAQTKQAKALQISSKISAITKLLEQSDETLKELQLHKSENAKTIASKSQPFETNKKKLRSDLEKWYEELKAMDDI